MLKMHRMSEGEYSVAVIRTLQNPLIVPAVVNSSRPNFEVACLFNAGVAAIEKR